jgi:hypothetical protein
MKRWGTMAKQPGFKDVKLPIQQGIENLQKWYRKVEGTSSAYFICLRESSTLWFVAPCQLLIQKLSA